MKNLTPNTILKHKHYDIHVTFLRMINDKQFRAMRTKKIFLLIDFTLA
jgi:hypothetical protein